MVAVVMGAGSSLLGAVGHAVIATDTGGVVRFWNDAAEDILGWLADDAFGRPLAELIDPQRLSERELIVRHRDGRQLTLLITSRPWRDTSGNRIGYVHTGAESHDADRTSRDVIEALEHLADGYFTLDAGLRVTFVNRRAEEAFGLPREAMLGRPFSEVVGPRGHDDLSVIEQVLASGEAAELECYSDLGQAWLNIRITPTSLGVAVTFHDSIRSGVKMLAEVLEAQAPTGTSNRDT